MQINYQIDAVSHHGSLNKMLSAMNSGFQCAGCGEWNETVIDSSAGSKQSYVEDCQICCKPNVLHVSWDMSSGEYVIRAELE
jgi:Cysteine-rich CPXCG